MWRRYEIRDRIQQLDPKTDCQQILFFTGTFEFPWLVRKSLEFALFRSFGAPSISKILDRTGQFRDHGQRRFDDTALAGGAGGAGGGAGGAPGFVACRDRFGYLTP